MSGTKGRIQITIVPGGWELEGDVNLTVLEATIRAGLRLPSSCRNGTCRTCICRLTSGRIHYRIEWPGLSIDEKRDGYILPCIAYPQADLTIEAPYAARLR